MFTTGISVTSQSNIIVNIAHSLPASDLGLEDLLGVNPEPLKKKEDK